MGKKKTWTWKELYEVAESNGVWQTVLYAPKRLQPGLAAAFSVIKWAPGENVGCECSCGLCVLYNLNGGVNCVKCPLAIKDRSCLEKGSLFSKVTYDNGKYDRKLYAVLVEIYREEWEKL